MKLKYILFGCLVIFSLTFISAMDISFYYSNNCQYCQSIKPFVMTQVNKYPLYKFGVYEISSNKDNYNAFVKNNFGGVPAFVIKTNDCRKIKFTGADKNKLHCELQEMTTKECPTYSGEVSPSGSWFIN